MGKGYGAAGGAYVRVAYAPGEADVEASWLSRAQEVLRQGGQQ